MYHRPWDSNPAYDARLENHVDVVLGHCCVIDEFGYLRFSHLVDSVGVGLALTRLGSPPCPCFTNLRHYIDGTLPDASEAFVRWTLPGRRIRRRLPLLRDVGGCRISATLRQRGWDVTPYQDSGGLRRDIRNFIGPCESIDPDSYAVGRGGRVWAYYSCNGLQSASIRVAGLLWHLVGCNPGSVVVALEAAMLTFINLPLRRITSCITDLATPTVN
jgi:hypothetical protein